MGITRLSDCRDRHCFQIFRAADSFCDTSGKSESESVGLLWNSDLSELCGRELDTSVENADSKDEANIKAGVPTERKSDENQRRFRSRESSDRTSCPVS